jgi:hypothetical protein
MKFILTFATWTKCWEALTTSRDMYYCGFVEVGSVKEKSRNMKVMYWQVGVSLAHKRVKPSRSSYVLPDKLVDRL